jgi:hypothetical protein
MICEGIKSSGEDTLVNIELDGHWRRVSLSREAIEDYLQQSPEVALKMSADQRCSFVRDNLAYVFAAARRKIEGRQGARRIWLVAGDL